MQAGHMYAEFILNFGLVFNFLSYAIDKDSIL